MSAKALLDRLDKVRHVGPNKWTACCPAHDDKNPSLSIKEDGGKILIKCFAGCGAADVVAAVGLSLSDLMDPCGEHRAPWWADMRKPEPAKQYHRTLAIIAEHDKQAGIKPTPADLRHRREAWLRANRKRV